MRAACAAFNHLPFADRSAFTDLVLRGVSLDKVARSAGESATEVARRARRALDAILTSALQDQVKESTGRTT
jgi:DNA-directed RNA polymerase specialized sigma24 family protein